MRLLHTMLVAALSVSMAGCFRWDNDDKPFVDDGFQPEPTVQQAPTIENILVPSWPPVGPSHIIQATVESPSGVPLDSIQFQFRHTVTKPSFGVVDQVMVSGAELGEGMGQLTIRATDALWRQATRRVNELVVDLSPPEIITGETILRHGQDSVIELYLADAWVIGGMRFDMAGVILEKEFEEGWPATLGTEWDLSLVQFDTSAFPEGEHEAAITAWDAAGNIRTMALDLRLDGTAPTAAITSPQPGSTLSGSFDVGLSGDDAGQPVWLELSVGGTPVATAVGPNATVTLDASEFTPGVQTLEAVAYDEAGNASAPVTISVTLQ